MATNTPISVERLAEIRDHAAYVLNYEVSEYERRGVIEVYVPELAAEVERLRAELAKPKGEEVLDWVAECDKPGHPDWYLHTENWPSERRGCPTCAVEQAEAERDEARAERDIDRHARDAAETAITQLRTDIDAYRAELLHATGRDPRDATITPETAAHVLHHFGEGGYEPGSFTRDLILLIARADPTHRARLSAIYPAQVSAVDLAQNTEVGIAQLKAIAEQVGRR